MNKKVTIIDYGLGNLFSVARAFESLGANVCITSNASEIAQAGHLILPGVGAFSKGMQELESRGFIEVIRKYAVSGKPLMGICLGMQMLFETGEENGEHNGLGIIKGRVTKIPAEKNAKIPHIGWAKIIKNGNPKILEGIGEEHSFYFVHSYRGICENPSDLAAFAIYGENKITASVEKGNVFGCQFHPEKSAESGLQICRNFLEL